MNHISVLLNESIAALNVRPEGTYVDMTLGTGGHSYEICRLLTSGQLIGLDKDDQAIERSQHRLQSYQDKITLVQTSFTGLSAVLSDLKIDRVDGVLFDLGVSSPQFDDEARGFSYRFDSRLDMRMDRDQKLSAYEVVNEYSEEVLVAILKDYADERYALAIARMIIKQRPLETTFDLVEAVRAAYPSRELRKGHPAKKTFQAIRMAVNNELEEVSDALHQAIRKISVGGRVVVITFHSIEDRLVKTVFNEYGKKKKVNPRIPTTQDEVLNYRIIVKGSTPDASELEENRRAHSAKLRVIERIG